MASEDKRTEARRMSLMSVAMLLMAAVMALQASGEHGWTFPRVVLLVAALAFLVFAGVFAWLGYRQGRSASGVTGHE